jgi:hypothetical protein
MLKGKGHLVELKSSPINCFFVLVAENVLRNVLTISDVKIQFFIEQIDLSVLSKLLTLTFQIETTTIYLFVYLIKKWLS